MWRQEILRITLIGIILGTVGVYLWKQTHFKGHSARSSALNPQGLDSVSRLTPDRSDRTSPARSDYASWQAGVGEVPSWSGDMFPGPPPPSAQTSPALQADSPTPARRQESSEPNQGDETASESGKEALPSNASDQSPAGQAMPPPDLLPLPLPWEEEPEEKKRSGMAVLPSPEASESLEPEPLEPISDGQDNSESLQEPTSEAIFPSVVATPDAGPNVQPTGNPLRMMANPSSEETDLIAGSEGRFENLPNQLEEKSSPLALAGMASDAAPEVLRPPGDEAVRFPSSWGSKSLGETNFPQTEGLSPAESSGETGLATDMPKTQFPALHVPDTPLPTPTGQGTTLPTPKVPELSNMPASSPEASPPPDRGAGDEGGGPEKRVSVQGGCSAESCLRPETSPIAPQAARAHKMLFYDNQFAYLEDPCQQETFLGDRLKQLQITPWAKLDIGGEYRLRHHSEHNHRGRGLTGLDDDFLLHRTRLYANLEMGEWARIYAEMNDALSTNETYPPRPIEENRTELQNLFIDVAVLGFRSDGLAARLGRQELLYGAGRLVSPLDWANTRRTFEGYKLFWQGPLWTVDAFWVRPIYPNPDVFDSPDQSQQLMGLYLVRRLDNQAVLEGYYLRLVEEDGLPDFDFHTLGFRSQQEYNGWLGELEAALQVGSYGTSDHTAGMYTIGVGRRFQSLPGQPVVWIYYDWASGDRTLGNGFHHLMPDSHQYLGLMDLFGRRNIEDWSFHVQVHPHRDWSVRLAWHIFHRQNPMDVPYGVEMTPLVTTPGGSGDYGQELDLLLQWVIRPRAELAFGYSRFFAGQFFRTNPSPPAYQDDADFFYTQFSLRF